jgi:MoaA/NifB/PqqE/SkfB family radical SAM enzyme
MILPYKNLRRFAAKFFKQPLYALKVGYRRLQALVCYYGAGGKSSYPESLTFFLTHRCNLRCKMCGQWGESGVSLKIPQEQLSHELNIGDYEKIISQIAYFRPNITLFGGEPLLHPDFKAILDSLKRHHLHCLMITNGSLLKVYAKDIVELGLDELNVSLDGVAALHDSIRGLPGVFDQIKEGLVLVDQFKKEKKSKKPLINIQCTINAYNYEYLEELLEVAKEVGANALTYHHLIFLNKGLIEKQKDIDATLECSSRGWEGFVFEPKLDYAKLDEKIKFIKSGKYPFSLDFFPNFSSQGLKEYYTDSEYKPQEYPGRCLSPWITAYVFPDGGLRPCLNSTFSYGNLKEEDFRSIWNSAQAIKFRQALKGNKMFPVCARCTELYRY